MQSINFLNTIRNHLFPVILEFYCAICKKEPPHKCYDSFLSFKLFYLLVQFRTCRDMIINHQKMKFFFLGIFQVAYC